MGKIFKNLNDEEITPPSENGLWSIPSVNNILGNSIYTGVYIHNQQFKNPELKQPLVPNRGEVPMVYIEEHHPAIIDKEVWEKVQEKKLKKWKGRKSISIEFEKEEVKNEAFSDIFECGECGNTVGFMRYINKKRPQKKDKETGEITRFISTKKNSSTLVWRCNHGIRNMLQACDARQFNQEYLELNFHHLMIELLTSLEFKTSYEKLFNELELTNEDLEREQQLIKDMNHLYQLLYKAVDEELNKKGRDSRWIDKLTGNIIAIQEQIKAYNMKREKQTELKEEIEWLMSNYTARDFKDRSRKHDFQGFDQTRVGKKLLPAGTLDTGLKVEEASFDKELFERFIESGILYGDGKAEANNS